MKMLLELGDPQNVGFEKALDVWSLLVRQWG